MDFYSLRTRGKSFYNQAIVHRGSKVGAGLSIFLSTCFSVPLLQEFSGVSGKVLTLSTGRNTVYTYLAAPFTYGKKSKAQYAKHAYRLIEYNNFSGGSACVSMHFFIAVVLCSAAKALLTRNSWVLVLHAKRF